MATQNLRFRLTATVAATSLVFAQLVPLPAAAQGQPPQPPPGAQDQQATGDPPERVGRLARVTGTVSFHTQDEDQWSPATANYPVTAGNSFWTDANAQAEIEVSASRVAMAPGTELDVATLSNTAFEATEPQGEIYLRVRAVTPDETYAVQTAARIGHPQFAGSLRLGCRRHADADRGNGHRGFRPDCRPRPVASGRGQSDRHDQRHRHAPGRGRRRRNVTRS